MKERLLIACSDDGCRSKIVNLLSGKEVVLHSVWQDADLLLEILEHDYELIIYDLDISTLNGLKMVKIIRKIRPKVVLLVVSSDESKELGGKVLQEGVAYYGIKPVNPTAMQGVLYSALKLTSVQN